MSLRVRATQRGFYGAPGKLPCRIDAGEEFDLHDEKLFSDKWMVKVGESSKVVFKPEAVANAKSAEVEDDVI